MKCVRPNLLALALTFGSAAAWSARAPSLAQDPAREGLGYQDTPLLPGGRWHVHDGERPQPPVVEAAAPVTTPPPSDAKVLFDGTSLDAWTSGGEAARWSVVDGAMQVGEGALETRERFGDVQLHLEWASPAVVEGSSQGRGNSGVFLMGRYEIQVLDSHDNPTYPDGQAAALYGQQPPLVNATRAPGEWQSYDILFRAPRFEGERVVEPARVTVLHNGVCVQLDEAFLGATTHRALAQYGPHEATGPIVLQDHGNPVRYRNVWVRPLGARE